MSEMTHDQIVAICTERDKKPDQVVFYLTAGSTFRLTFIGITWGALAMNERYCMVKNRNIFDTITDATAAIARAIHGEGFPD